MYIIKNALRCIARSKGRNLLISIIAMVIAVSACIGLSIRQAAENAKSSALEGMSITAAISYDRRSAMNGIGAGGGGKFDREQFSSIMGGASALTLDEYRYYAEAESVRDFYYTLTAYLNGSEDFEPLSSENGMSGSGFDASRNGSQSILGGMSGGMGGRGSSGDFTVIGFSSDSAMTDFVTGVSSITAGEVFAEGTLDLTCIISEELALYNGLEVGQTISLTNPLLDTESYELTISGIYSSVSSNEDAMQFGMGQDPANKIYMSSAALQSILDASESASVTVTNESSGRETQSALTGSLSATYVFADTEAYYKFENEARTMGLDEAYTISSTDITAFENSLAPLKTLSITAGGALIVVLTIGAIILVVLNIFNVRERKYEIGVLTAMGMKKWKVAVQFTCEILVVTMIAVILGAGIGAFSSVPVANALLETQVENQTSQQIQVESNFGRPGLSGGIGNIGGAASIGGFGVMGDKTNALNKGGMWGGTANYITEIDSAMNLTVVVQMMGIGLLLTFAASAVSVLFVMRYDPLKILANRD